MFEEDAPPPAPNPLHLPTSTTKTTTAARIPLFRLLDLQRRQLPLRRRSSFLEFLQLRPAGIEHESDVGMFYSGRSPSCRISRLLSAFPIDSEVYTPWIQHGLPTSAKLCSKKKGNTRLDFNSPFQGAQSALSRTHYSFSPHSDLWCKATCVATGALGTCGSQSATTTQPFTSCGFGVLHEVMTDCDGGGFVPPTFK